MNVNTRYKKQSWQTRQETKTGRRTTWPEWTWLRQGTMLLLMLEHSITDKARNIAILTKVDVPQWPSSGEGTGEWDWPCQVLTEGKRRKWVWSRADETDEWQSLPAPSPNTHFVTWLIFSVTEIYEVFCNFSFQFQLFFRLTGKSDNLTDMKSPKWWRKAVWLLSESTVHAPTQHFCYIVHSTLCL